MLGYSAASPYQWGAFVPGAPDVTEFPHHIFSKIQTRLSREPQVNNLIYSNAGGSLELRQELAEYLKIARSVQCDADQIIITEGTHQAIDLVSRTLSDIGDEVWIEDPAYWARVIFYELMASICVPYRSIRKGLFPICIPRNRLS